MSAWVLPAILEEVPELTWQRSAEEATQDILDSCSSVNRVELVAFKDSRAVGFCSLVAEEDPHVGRCLSVQWCYVLRGHRGIGAAFIRRAYAVAARIGAKVLCRTQRTGTGEYRVKFINLE